MITDILMPEKDGLETITQSRKTHPQLKIIAMSGGGRHVGTDALVDASSLGAHQTLEKPFEPEQLVKILLSLISDDHEED